MLCCTIASRTLNRNQLVLRLVLGGLDFDFRHESRHMDSLYARVIGLTIYNLTRCVMSLDKSTLLNIQKMITFLRLLVLYLSDANMEINKY